ncbi:hypothetical protein I79_005149 [Cricetulus griseus]|uniref:Uncharacterized protein n=1 Tax=Cricetulus griseus TaxID=10029 RepID=G3H4E9_CRIGR|nr:hypothetical protein I79_005149 [Cricetulus griseus]
MSTPETVTLLKSYNRAHLPPTAILFSMNGENGVEGTGKGLQVCLPLLGHPSQIPILEFWVVIAHGEATWLATQVQSGQGTETPLQQFGMVG